MKKLIASIVIILMLVGCSSQSTITSDGEHPKTTPEQNEEAIQASPSISHSTEPALETSIHQTTNYLDAEKLKVNFGFADAEGKKILVTGHDKGLDQEMAQLNEAIGDQGKVLKVKFMKWQDGTDDSNGREMSHNFVNLADLSEDRQLYLVQFNRLDQDMLFSIVLTDKDELTFMDYPAVIQGDEYSVWRVDDGGEVLPEMFSILFAAETINGPLLGLNWWGSEGVNTFFLNKDGETFKEMDIHYGRYTSPL